MKEDPFKDLTCWGLVLDILENKLSESEELSKCQIGLIRILRYKGNWRLREAVLNRVGEIRNPSNELVYQVLAILDDDNIYYDARILAGKALVKLLKNIGDNNGGDIRDKVRKVLTKLKITPQPPFFVEALKPVFSTVGLPVTMEH